MREIKFRAKSGKDGEWEYFDFNSESEVRELSYRIQKGWTVGLGQYTGLKDKNGKEIYEGDIVKNAWPHPYFIEYSKDWGAYMTVEKHGLNDSQAEYDYLSNRKDVEIIGNIYENPELLK